jgi:elongation factor P
MDVTNLRNGVVFKDGGVPFQVLKYTHIKMSRGSANVRVKARNLLTGQVLEKSWISSARVEDAQLDRKKAQYLYKDGSYNFMDPKTYDQFSIPSSVVGDSGKFFNEGDNIQILYFEGKPIGVELPKSKVFKIKYTEPGFKGNTVTNAFKDAKLENGTSVKVPGFIKIGDKVKIDTRSGEYISKA